YDSDHGDGTGIVSAPQLKPATATAEGPAVVDAPARGSPGRKLTNLAIEYAMVGVLIVVVIVASIIESRFLNHNNVSNILTQNAQVGLVAIGMTFVLIAGGFDLSVGGIFALAGVLYAHFANALPVGLAFVLMLL